MQTYSHAFFAWALAKHGVKAGRAAGIAGAVGGSLPDVPSIAGTIYYWTRDGSMWSRESLEAIYFTGPFGATGSALHSVVPAGTLLALYLLLRLGRYDRRHVGLWFLLGWAGHSVVDFFTHVDDTRPLFWPLSSWEWSSPVSYYDPAHYGVQFTLAEHGALLATMLTLLALRLRRNRRAKKSRDRGSF